MATELEVKNITAKLNGSGKSYSEFLAELFKDRFLEIYLGDQYEDVTTEQITTSYPAVLCGKVVSAYKECLIINAAFINKQKKLQLGNLLFINERSIRFLNEVDDNGTLEDMFLRSRESLDVKHNFADKK